VCTEGQCAVVASFLENETSRDREFSPLFPEEFWTNRTAWGGGIVAVDRDFIVPVQNVKSLQCKFLKASTSKEYEFQSNISKTT
jgi:23S rRNA U2552 (ribose-2'-O)-methylase RlmE/FtsJ